MSTSPDVPLVPPPSPIDRPPRPSRRPQIVLIAALLVGSPLIAWAMKGESRPTAPATPSVSMEPAAAQLAQATPAGPATSGGNQPYISGAGTAKPEAKVEPKPEAKPEPKAEAAPSVAAETPAATGEAHGVRVIDLFRKAGDDAAPSTPAAAEPARERIEAAPVAEPAKAPAVAPPVPGPIQATAPSELRPSVDTAKPTEAKSEPLVAPPAPVVATPAPEVVPPPMTPVVAAPASTAAPVAPAAPPAAAVVVAPASPAAAPPSSVVVAPAPVKPAAPVAVAPDAAMPLPVPAPKKPIKPAEAKPAGLQPLPQANGGLKPLAPAARAAPQPQAGDFADRLATVRRQEQRRPLPPSTWDDDEEEIIVVPRRRTWSLMPPFFEDAPPRPALRSFEAPPRVVERRAEQGPNCHYHAWPTEEMDFHRDVRCHWHRDARDPSLRYVR